MAPLPFWLLSCAVSLCFIFYTTDAEENFVRPPEAETNCSSHEPCFTLIEYAQEADQYFVDNATFTFMSGSHQLDTPLNLNGLSNIVLRVMNEDIGTVQMNFGPSVNIMWTNCLNISISGITFDITGLMSEGDFSALVFRGTSSIFLSDLTLNGSGWWRAVLLDGGDQIIVSDLSVFGAMSTSGSAVHASESSIDFYGKNKFTNNNATKIGGAIALKNGYSNLFEDFLFSDNSARYGGAVFISGGSLNMSGSFTFLNNAALVGGAMTIASSISDFSISGNISFTNNTATIYGGALHFHIDGHPYTKVISGRVLFVDNTASNGGAVSIEALSNLTMSGNVSFFNNTAKSNDGFGGAVYVVHGGVIFSGEVWFIDNSAIRGGAITLERGACHLSGDISFISNTATTEGGAMLLHNPEEIVSRLGGETVLYMTGNVSFTMNSAEQGGAIVFRDSARLMLTEPLQADFIDNHADTYGGAVFVSRDTTIRSLCFERPSSDSETPLDECFFELDSESNIHLNFSYNSAGNAGAVLFGGNLERCEVKIGGTRYPLYVLQEKSDIFEILSDDNITSTVSSEPLRVYICEEASNSKLVDSLAKQIIRGREMVVFVDIVGQGNGTVPSSVRVSLNNDIGLDAAQRIQKTEKGCTRVSYRLKNKQNTTTVTLFPDEGPCRGIGISSAVVNVTFLPCPDGFTRDGSACACEERLQLPEYNVTCSVDDKSIFRRSNSFWMGTVYDNETYEGLILHDGCPLDYCTSSPVNFTLDNLDGQCDHNRSGILCGSCQDSHSIAFGSLHCLPCSNENLSLILLFALAGIALVAALLILQLSATANGTFNGLIFYANVVQANRSLFIPLGDTNVLTVFIAWLNLDLGIETCFYDGMNAYVFTWLQFLFPFYVWILIGLIIVMSHYSRRVSKIFGTNPVAALATLLLLSYSKILQTVIFALSYTTLVYPDNTPRHVWLYDGSVPYFQRADHIVLGIFAITVLLFLFLPYTLLLLCGHWLQACSNRKFLSWINKIMPFLNAYYAPFKKETRYWTGLILLVRCGVFIAFSFNVDGNADTKINLLIISTVTVCLATVAWLHHGIYERFYNDLLEGSFILNLCLFAAATYHVEDQAALAYSSIGIAFATFVCIVLFHVYLVLHNTSIWKKTVDKIKMSLRTEHGRDRRKSSNKLENRESGVRGPTITFLELRESLLVINVQNQPQTVQTEC